MENVLTENYKTYEINIVLDDDSENPRTSWDNFGKMVCFHRRYNLGDKHNFEDSTDLIKYLKENKAIYLPLFLYDHSGITIKTSHFNCQWDSGQVGYIYVLPTNIYKEFSCKKINKEVKQKVLNLLESEVITYNKYLIGEVYGYEITDSKGEYINSCYGYYIEPGELMNECKEDIDKHYSYQLELDLVGG